MILGLMVFELIKNFGILMGFQRFEMGFDKISNNNELLELFIYFTIDEKFIKIVHVVSETLPHLKIKFCLCFSYFLCVCLNVLVSFLSIYRDFIKIHQHIQTYPQK
jgi:hypothetical protein